MPIRLKRVKQIGIGLDGTILDMPRDASGLLTIQVNVASLIKREEMTVNAWSHKYGLTQSTVARIVTGKLDPSTKVVERLAGAVGLQGWQLLVPGLDAGNPPRLRQMTEAEAKLYAKLRQDIQELAEFQERNTGHGDL